MRQGGGHRTCCASRFLALGAADLPGFLAVQDQTIPWRADLQDCNAVLEFGYILDSNRLRGGRHFRDGSQRADGIIRAPHLLCAAFDLHTSNHCYDLRPRCRGCFAGCRQHQRHLRRARRADASAQPAPRAPPPGRLASYPASRNASILFEGSEEKRRLSYLHVRKEKKGGLLGARLSAALRGMLAQRRVRAGCVGGQRSAAVGELLYCRGHGRLVRVASVPYVVLGRRERVIRTLLWVVPFLRGVSLVTF